MVFVVLFVVVVVAAAVVCNFCRTQTAVGHRIQGGSPATLLFPYADGYNWRELKLVKLSEIPEKAAKGQRNVLTRQC